MRLRDKLKLAWQIWKQFRKHGLFVGDGYVERVAILSVWDASRPKWQKTPDMLERYVDDGFPEMVNGRVRTPGELHLVYFRLKRWNAVLQIALESKKSVLPSSAQSVHGRWTFWNRDRRAS